MAAGSYPRFFVGILLSLAVLASFFSDGRVSLIALLLAFIFLILTAVWAVFRV
jgi:hypothetical protein